MPPPTTAIREARMNFSALDFGVKLFDVLLKEQDPVMWPVGMQISTLPGVTHYSPVLRRSGAPSAVRH
jgi:hypothetical protein